MVQYWEPGTQYNLNDVVEYEGHRYKIIQPHRSQGDWTPPVTPALWGRLSDQDHSYGGNNNNNQGGDKHTQNQGYQPQYQPPQNQQPIQPPQYNQHDNKHDNKHDNDDDKKHWYEEGDNKKKLGIAGGVLGGAALLATGMYAYKKHEEHKEEREREEQEGHHGNHGRHNENKYRD